jgi:hypothetical protein
MKYKVQISLGIFRDIEFLTTTLPSYYHKVEYYFG